MVDVYCKVIIESASLTTFINKRIVHSEKISFSERKN